MEMIMILSGRPTIIMLDINNTFLNSSSLYNLSSLIVSHRSFIINFFIANCQCVVITKAIVPIIPTLTLSNSAIA